MTGHCHSSPSVAHAPCAGRKKLGISFNILCVRAFLILGAVGLIPVALFLGNEKKRLSADHERAADLSALFLLSWVSPLVSVASLLWTLASVYLFCSIIWNLQLVRLVVFSSIDFWFLVLQALGLFVALCDAVEYDERCSALVAWVLLYASCLLSDCILPTTHRSNQGLWSASRVEPISKRFLGLAPLLPLLIVQRLASLHLDVYERRSYATPTEDNDTGNTWQSNPGGSGIRRRAVSPSVSYRQLHHGQTDLADTLFPAYRLSSRRSMLGLNPLFLYFLCCFQGISGV